MARRNKAAVVQIKLRIREDLRQRLESEAKKERRSLNQQAVSRLEQSYMLEAQLAEAKLKIAKHELEGELLEMTKHTLHQLHQAQGTLFTHLGASPPPPPRPKGAGLPGPTTPSKRPKK